MNVSLLVVNTCLDCCYDFIFRAEFFLHCLTLLVVFVFYSLEIGYGVMVQEPIYSWPLTC